LLNVISDPKPTDTFLDPFVGSGAIPEARGRYFPCVKIIAIDRNPQTVRLAQKRLKRFPNAEVRKGDALNSGIPDNSIDVIVTDPPWGEFQRISNPEDFYRKMLQEFKRILKPEGRAVILMGRNQEEPFEKILKEEGLGIKERTPILVAGRKATVYLLKTSFM
ncbi:MAG: TRM11 family SAM-dependent methyltransferase, partial [Microgenomates group bacterium]